MPSSTRCSTQSTTRSCRCAGGDGRGHNRAILRFANQGAQSGRSENIVVFYLSRTVSIAPRFNQPYVEALLAQCLSLAGVSHHHKERHRPRGGVQGCRGVRVSGFKPKISRLAQPKVVILPFCCHPPSRIYHCSQSVNHATVHNPSAMQFASEDALPQGAPAGPSVRCIAESTVFHDVGPPQVPSHLCQSMRPE